MKRKHAKKVVWIFALIAILTMATACSSTPSSSASSSNNASASTKKMPTLKVGYNLWVGSAGLYIAEKKGYFKDAGLNVKLVEFSDPTASAQALLSNNVDIAGTTLDTAVTVKSKESSGTDLRFFHITDQSSGADGIVSKSSIQSIADLKGKTIAVTVGAVNNFLLDHALQQAGMSESDVTLTNVEPDQTGPLFLSGKVDAAVTWEPYLSEAKAKGGNLVYTTKDAPDLIIDGDVTTEKLIKAQPEALQKYNEAVERGTQFYLDHPDEGAAIVAEKLSTTKEEVQSMMGGVKLATQADGKQWFTAKQDVLVSRVNDYSNFFKGRNLISKDVNGTDLIDGFLYK